MLTMRSILPLSNPQEVTADMFGGVAPGEMNGGTSVRTKDDENVGVWYLMASYLFGPLAYLFFAFV